MRFDVSIALSFQNVAFWGEILHGLQLGTNSCEEYIASIFSVKRTFRLELYSSQVYRVSHYRRSQQNVTLQTTRKNYMYV
jgi:hypothetical protein